ncbi:sigma-54-dependent transcriptional regulator [Desulfurivibrio alkaliphilus]|uniref:Two component, sigma54 specific, transcriptional regulator, Fis family n=1 Tax=Desulfurivibrio alkaliphilus (strain DSM 19089 / UNIQEM U267 / AHT2) TaxID=589865 RepID=D6Z4J6_DESAT|nr:sigma-54 dependent transcriptional regulator [Desulfurivibrio alkaliphilus]ADH86471.1 two component, sigma54 specific, transcriptional regulator, Fis family [Desulfurivibrio alkaliphilus AHT 2]
MVAKRILLVDDDLNLLDLIRIRLEASGYQVAAVGHENEAKRLVAQQPFDAAVIDLQLVSQDGITLMEELHRDDPGLPVIILTAHGSIESAVDAMARGAFTYLTKPFDSRELILQIERALEQARLNGELHRLRELVEEKRDFGNIIARSEPMRRVLDQVARIADSDSTVAIYGASGTGKELIAKAIHLAGPRREAPFLAINCAAIPENLLESELFGHEKGAFTGAIRKKPGLFAQAEQGTVFLDEIGELPLPLQGKLLRVLQERTIMPLGGEQQIPIDVRVIVATNKNLKEEVKKGAFREDLFYRVHVIPVHIPPLRDRKEDIPPLVEYFLRRHSEQTGKKKRTIAPAALQKLMLHDWPGNVRELENAIEFALAMARSGTIGAELILPANADHSSLPTLKDARDGFEKNYLRDLLKATAGNISRAAKLAGKYRADLYNMLKKHGISPGEFKD